MASTTDGLTQAVARHLAEWEVAHVERAIYGTDDPEAIARALQSFCHAELGAAVHRTLLYASSIGAVAAVELSDGRRVVIKAHQPDWSRERLREVRFLQSHLAQQGLLAPAVLAGPAPLGRGFALVEDFVQRGAFANPHEPDVRRAIVAALHEIVVALDPFVKESRLPPHLLAAVPDGRLWPTPHSRLFDFEKTRAGAQDIDALARAARSALRPVGRYVLGHDDLRAEHLRFEGQRPVAAFDWDSLSKTPEPSLVGFTAHAFCADFSRDDHVQAPSIDEARAFVAEYEQARGARFDAAERASCSACFAYAVAYTARCAHALGQNERGRPGSFQHLVARYENELLEVFGR